MIIAPSDALTKALYYYGMLEDKSIYKIVCPFHYDVNASLKINLEDGSFFCFGCNKTGDALKFVLLIEEIKGQNNELLSCLKYFKILKSNKIRAIKNKRSKLIKNDNEQALVIAWDYYNGLKKENWYLSSSKIKSYMEQRGFSCASLNKCKAKANYSSNYPIIFPIYDMSEFKGWVCRTDNKVIEKKRKYLYNEGFSRSSTLVGRYDNSIVMIVEGYMDWLKMKQFGVKYVCAILGWKATEEQIKKLKSKGVKTLIIALDNDECGKKGCLHLSKFFDIIRFSFPEGKKDPGELDFKSFRIAERKIKNEIRRLKNEEGERRIVRANETSNKKIRY